MAPPPWAGWDAPRPRGLGCGAAGFGGKLGPFLACFRATARLFHLFISLQCAPVKCRRLPLPSLERMCYGPEAGGQPGQGSRVCLSVCLSPPLAWEGAECPEAHPTGRLNFYRPFQLLLPAGRGAAARGIPGGWEPRPGRALGTSWRRAAGSRCPSSGEMFALRTSRRGNPTLHGHFLTGGTELPCSCAPEGASFTQNMTLKSHLISCYIPFPFALWGLSPPR